MTHEHVCSLCKKLASNVVGFLPKIGGPRGKKIRARNQFYCVLLVYVRYAKKSCPNSCSRCLSQTPKSCKSLGRNLDTTFSRISVEIARSVMAQNHVNSNEAISGVRAALPDRAHPRWSHKSRSHITKQPSSGLS